MLLSILVQVMGLVSAPPLVFCRHPVVDEACWVPLISVLSAQATCGTVIMLLL